MIFMVTYSCPPFLNSRYRIQQNQNHNCRICVCFSKSHLTSVVVFGTSHSHTQTHTHTHTTCLFVILCLSLFVVQFNYLSIYLIYNLFVCDIFWLWWSVLRFISFTVPLLVNILQIFTFKVNPSVKVYQGGAPFWWFHHNKYVLI